MYNGLAQSKVLLTPSGQLETITTLEYGYMLVSTDPKEPVMLFGRNGSSATEEVSADDIPGLREFIATIMPVALEAGGQMKMLHFQPHDERGREMKIVAGLRAMNLRGFHLIQIIPVPLDMPTDRNGQLAYDFEPFEATFAARFAVRH